MIKLTVPIQYKGNKIIALEVLEPKSGQMCISGWEHAEFVIDTPFEAVVSKYADLEWNLSSIDRPVWSHLKLKLDDNTQVKFHKFDLLESVRLDETL